MKGDDYVFHELAETEFALFAGSHPLGNFFQSPEMASRFQLSGGRVKYIGMRSGKAVVAAAAIYLKPVSLGYWEAECYRGPILDYGNHDLLSTFLRRLLRHLKGLSVISLRVGPPVVCAYHDDQRSLCRREDVRGIIAIMRRCGFRHIGEESIDRDDSLLRWHYVKELPRGASYDDVFASFDRRTKGAIKKARHAGVVVDEVTDQKDVPMFYDIVRQTASRRGFSVRGFTYYDSIFSAFDRNQAIFCVARLDPLLHKTSLRGDLEKIEYDMRAVEDPAADYRRMKDLILHKERLLSNLRYAEALADDDAIPVAAALFIRSGEEMVYLSSGTVEEHRAYNGQYLLQEYAIRRAIEQGLRRYNFYGTSGAFNGHLEQNGVYRFKKGFCGALEEQIGYFDIVLNKIIFNGRRSKRSLDMLRSARMLDGIKVVAKKQRSFAKRAPSVE